MKVTVCILSIISALYHFPQRDLSRKYFLNGIICSLRKDQLNIGVINVNIAEQYKMKIFWFALYLVHLITNALI